MNRLNHIDYYKIENEEDIRVFVGLFLHAWGDFMEEARQTENIRPLPPEDDFTQLDDSKKALYKRYLFISPHEEKTEEILTSLLRAIIAHGHIVRVYFSGYYNDRYFRDIYSLYYSKTHYTIESKCGRFFLFDDSALDKGSEEQDFQLNDAFIGVIVRRPLSGSEIGRTLIDPVYLHEAKWSSDNKGILKSNVWRNKYEMTMFGIPLSVWAFPYSMQDGEVSTCAETTVLNMNDYYSHRYPDYKRYLPSEITQIVRNNSNVRNLPSHGLSYDMVSRIFVEMGFSPILFSASNFRNKFVEILHSYVASGIPVALGISNDSDHAIGHSVIVIGTSLRLIDAEIDSREKAFSEASVLHLPYRDRNTTYYLIQKGAIDSGYIIMDDGKAPYAAAKIYEDNGTAYLKYDSNGDTWNVSIFAVPMGKDMAMDAEAAIGYFRSILVNEVLGYSDYISRLKEFVSAQEYELLEAGKSKDNPLLTRVFLCSSKRLKDQRIRHYERINDQTTCKAFQMVHLPRFVWVCELYTKKSYCVDTPECVGEIIIDASQNPLSQDNDSNVVWINYPRKYAFRLLGDDIGKLRESMQEQIIETNGYWYPLTPYEFELH